MNQGMMGSCHGKFSALLTFCQANLPVTGAFAIDMASNTGIWCFFWCMLEQTFEQIAELPKIWSESPLRYRSLAKYCCSAKWLDLSFNTFTCCWKFYDRTLVAFSHVHSSTLTIIKRFGVTLKPNFWKSYQITTTQNIWAMLSATL